MSVSLFVSGLRLLQAIIPGVIKDDGAFTAQVIDTAQDGGGEELVFVAQIGSIDADMAALKVMQSDTKTNATTLGGTPTTVVDVLATTTPGDANDNDVVVVRVNLKGPHSRYMQLQATAGDGAAGTYLSAIAMITNSNVPPTNLGADILVSA